MQPKTKPIDKEYLMRRVRGLLGCYRNSVTEETVVEYAQTLASLTREEFDAAVVKSKDLSDDGFAPAPGEIRAIAMEIREAELAKSDGALEEMKNWEPSNPEWPEVQEFRTLLSKVAHAPKEEVKR